MDYQKTHSHPGRPRGKCLTASESLPVEKSDFFRAACTKPWKETVEGTVRLLEISQEQLYDYLTWVYKDVVASPFPAEEGRDSPNGDHDDDRWDLHTDQWITGNNRLGDIRYRNAALTSLVQVGRDCLWGPDWDVINKTWDHVSYGSPLRRLLIDSYISYGRVNATVKEWNRFNQEFMVAVHDRASDVAGMAYSRKLSKVKRPDLQPPCHYHEHNEQVPPCSPEAPGKSGKK